MYSFQMWSTEGISDFTSVSLSLKVNIWLWEKDSDGLPNAVSDCIHVILLSTC